MSSTFVMSWAEKTPAHPLEEPATLDEREVQPSRGRSIIATDLERHADRLDAVAGSEFIDDRIREQE